MLADRFLLLAAKQRRPSLIGQDCKQSLLVNQFGLKTVYHADCTGPIRVQQRRTLADNRQIFINQQALVNDINLKIPGTETVVTKLKLLRCTNNCRVPLPFKELFE